MQKNILWAGIEYDSLENCMIKSKESGVEINSVIIGSYKHEIYRVSYLIKTNEHWATVFFELEVQFSDRKLMYSYNCDREGNWTKNGSAIDEFKGCIDIDISLTPFTNSLPINRLKLEINERRQIKVLYIDILNQEIKPVLQNYTRISDVEYKFENVPNDFEAIISIDEDGFVVNYPNLFVRQEIS